MTPLLETKTPSAPAGNKSGGDARAARSLLSCAFWHGMGRLWRGMGGRRPPLRNTACWVFAGHESRNMFCSCPPATPRRATPSPAYWVFTNHGFFSNHGLLSASMPCPLVPTIARYCPALLGKKILSRQASARRPAFWLDLTAGLHVSTRGEVKWVRGPSGSGASRAEEKGACRCSGRIASLRPSYYEICNTAFTVYPPSDISSGAN